MTTVYDIINHEITANLIEINYGDLYELVSQDADSAVIYYHDCHKIYCEASQDEIEDAAEQMHDTGFVFESMQQTEQICAYWIIHARLMEQYRQELEEDLKTLEDKRDLINYDSDLYAELEEAIDKINNEL